MNKLGPPSILGLPVPQVKFTGGDIEDPVHTVAAAYEFRSILHDMMQLCSELWKLNKAPDDFVA